MTFSPLKTAAAALAIAALHLPLSAPMAADAKPGAVAPKSSFSEKQLTTFAAAAKDVFAIRQKYAAQFEAAADETKKKQIVQVAQAEMKKAIQDKGLTIEQYNDVLVAAKDDQALADKLGKMMDSGKSSKGG